MREGSFFGWPWFYIGGNEDPNHRGERPDLKDKVALPDVLIEAHSASLGMTVYDDRNFRRTIVATSLPPSMVPGIAPSAPATKSFA